MTSDDFKPQAKQKDNIQASEGSEIQTSEMHSSVSEFESLKKLHNLQDSIDLIDCDIYDYTVEECDAEVERCLQMNKHYRRLMYLLAVNSGWHNFTDNFNLQLISNKMKKSSAEYTGFMATTNFAWSLKPLYGWTSDSFYPFKRKFKPYVTLMQSVYITIALYIALHTLNFQVETPAFNLAIFKLLFFAMNVCVGFQDALAQGLSVVTTKLDNKIIKLKERKGAITGDDDQIDKNQSMKSYSIFNLIRGLGSTVASLLGGILVNKMPVGMCYLIINLYPIFMIFFVIAIFREPSVKFLIILNS
jgi:hypothetical protein